MSKKIVSVFVAVVMILSVCILDTSDTNAASAKYWLKVNKKANVVTAYKLVNGKYKPYRAMLASSGGSLTPSGTFYTDYKTKWNKLVGNTWGRYCTVITGDYLFHSVWYYNYNKQNSLSGKEYNKLGTACSHGCIRLSLIDAKWIYDNCSSNTKVTIYSSKNPGPLGKPKGLKVKNRKCWDPTDQDSKNPDYRLKKAVISIDKKKPAEVRYGKAYNIKKYVTAKNVNAYQDLTSSVVVASIKKYKSGEWISAEFSTKSVGTYKIKYKVRDKYCRGTTYKTFKLKVTDTLAPSITAGDRTVSVGSKDALIGVSAKQNSCDRTKAIMTYIKAPGESQWTEYDYTAAKAYKFGQAGTYEVKYTVKNKYSPYNESIKSVHITAE